MVLPTPPGHVPGKMACDGKFRPAPASCAVEAGVSPDSLALVAVMGPKVSTSFRAVGWARHRTATRSPPNRSSSVETASRMNVKPPLGNAASSRRIFSGTTTKSSACSSESTPRLTGLSAGRCLRAKRRSSASGRGRQANPGRAGRVGNGASVRHVVDERIGEHGVPSGFHPRRNVLIGDVSL